MPGSEFKSGTVSSSAIGCGTRTVSSSATECGTSFGKASDHVLPGPFTHKTNSEEDSEPENAEESEDICTRTDQRGHLYSYGSVRGRLYSYGSAGVDPS